MEKQQSENVLQQKEKHQRNAADLLVECLQEEGVEYIFGIPGEENLAVMNAIDQSPIRFITTRHEQGAAFMADVYGRLTGKAGGLSGYAGTWRNQPGNRCGRCRR